MDQANPKTMIPSTSAVTYWQIEMQEGPIQGKFIIARMVITMLMHLDMNSK